MNIGVIGLGKLGLPVALAMESKGHQISGIDANTQVIDNIQSRNIVYKEEGAQELLSHSSIRISSVKSMVYNCDLLFMAIQTPHNPKFEGVTRLPQEREDFDYSFLKTGVEEVAREATALKKQTTLVVISTVLPGTMEREIIPLLGEYVTLIYNPFFIAMGTAIQDFLHPEFVLLGSTWPNDIVTKFYKTIHDRPLFWTDVKTAELTKVAYNTFIGQKIIFANAMMEICQKTGANVDDLSKALSLATDRIISPKYLQGGMADGGGCHPRDNIALSWLSQKLNLSHDIFFDVMKTREDQTAWLTELAYQEYKKHPTLPLVILGKSYKPESNLTVGSPATLLTNIFKEKGIEFIHYDPYIDTTLDMTLPALYFIATKHQLFAKMEFTQGSVVIDPFGYIPNQEGVEVIHIGRK